MLEQELYKRGWQPDPTVRHTCRYISPINKAAVDIMAEQPAALGFAGRWYPEAVRHAGTHRLRTGCTIRIPSAPHLLACKLEAYRDRGRADPWTSTDLEDIVTLVDGRPSLLHEVRCSDVNLRTWLASEVSDLIANPVVFRDLAGYLSGGDSSGREQRLRRTLTALAASPS
jgi:hypothetical protein